MSNVVPNEVIVLDLHRDLLKPTDEDVATIFTLLSEQSLKDSNSSLAMTKDLIRVALVAFAALHVQKLSEAREASEKSDEAARRELVDMTASIFFDRCPGIVPSQEDVDFYKQAAAAAMTVLGHPSPTFASSISSGEICNSIQRFL